MFDCFLKRARTFGTTISVRGSLAELAEHLQFYKAEMAEAARVMIAKAEGEYYPVFAQKPKKEINAILKGSPSWTESWFVATFEYLYKRREQLDVNDVSDIIHTIVPVTHCHYVLLDSDTWHMVGVIRQRFEKLRGEKVPPIAKAYKPGDVEQFLADLATGPTATPAPHAQKLTFDRKAPCPCGSGQRYKHCHGQLK